MYEFYFEKLEVWKNARHFVKDIYLTTESFPNSEKFGLTSQIRRATVSITANIAEGFSRKTITEKARFINIAYSSAWEVINLLILSLDLEFMKEDKYLDLRKKAEHITNQLNALYKTLKSH
ncbi:four helix bundle protein [Gillisia limnaea]|uniref:S23 ribosomal protein n=1 Tax=Gillisia limnaea (strain DSM 15749 / LMG 21470 / R-8282) TaxID=865937 RepID=H2BSA8_GILLR|nr:four helix bundle protein [Gillisia limnaea]EHQ01431.1 S23 ribosomal protein [Gillisia limnaea DSM 15749]